MKRDHIGLKTKLCAALCALGEIPYEHAKLMTEDQVLSLFHFDHGILHAIDPIDEFWNLTPRFIGPHRQKSRGDTSAVAKVKRMEKKEAAHRSLILRAELSPEAIQLTAPKKKWPSRPFQSVKSRKRMKKRR